MVRTSKPAPINALFDYDSLEIAQRSIILQRTGEIRDRLRRSARDVWEIGQKLSDVRSRLKYGQFLAWIKAEFGWSQRTAYNFINVYETFGDRFANLATVNIATSVLYQLAAPSVPEELRDQVLRAAEQGEKITARQLRSTIKQRRQAKSKTARKRSAEKQNAASEPVIEGPEVITVIPRSIELSDPDDAGIYKPVTAAGNPVREVSIQPGWYQLDGQHLIFCGDTASQSFTAWAPAAKLAIAITGSDWDHDWLIDRADSVVVIPTAEYSTDKLRKLVRLLSNPGDVIIFPWLPYAEIIAIAHKLGRRVYGGEVDAERCERAIFKAGTPSEFIETGKVASLVV